MQNIQKSEQRQNNLKREGSNIVQLQKQVQKQSGTLKNELEDIKENNNDLTGPYGCIWGIQKFFDEKQCAKYFKKNFNQNQSYAIQGICKFRNKAFFVVKFSTPNSIDFQQFNNKFAKNKRTKLKPLQQGMNIEQFKFMDIAEVMKHAQKNSKVATQQELQKVRNTKIQDIVSPFHSMPYPQQVTEKIKQINHVIQKYNTQFFRDAEVKRLLKEQNKQIAPLKLTKFVQCQQKYREGYRSKSQFTIGANQQGDVVIGFNKGSYSNNTITVQSPKNVKIISRNTKLIVAVVQNFIKTNFKELLPFDRVNQVGFWRYLVVRESQITNQSMIIVVCKTQNLDEQLVKDVKNKFVQYLRMAIQNLKSLCFLSYNGASDSVPPEKPQLLYGTPYYQQSIFNHKFQVSPSAFLQINIPMCEVLYSQIIKAVCQCDIVLDLGSGIGTIGISVMNQVKKMGKDVKVIGIQICQEAVQDSRRNCPDYQVHLGRAQDHIKTVCQQNMGRRIVAILDPPRAGFNKQVLVALRRTWGLNNIIYVACNAGAIQDNLLQLTLPTTQRRKAPQFEIKSMLGFDLFPMTKHFQALYILQRV